MLWKKQLAPDEGFAELNAEPYNELQDLSRDAIPYAYDKAEESVIFLHPESAKGISAQDVAYLCTRPVITDGESIAILKARGFDLGIDCTVLGDVDGAKLQERFCEHPLKPTHSETYQTSPYGHGRRTCSVLHPREGDEILAVYAPRLKTTPAFYADERYPFGVAEAIVSMETGAKWAVLGYCPWRGNIPMYKRELLLNIADYISGNALPARLLSPVPAILLPRKDAAGKVMCVSLVNCTVGESGEMELLIRDPVGEKFTFMSQYNGTRTLSAQKSKDGYTVTVPSINAWSVATVFAE